MNLTNPMHSPTGIPLPRGMRRDRTQTQALQKMFNFYCTMVARPPCLVEGGYRMAACMRRQPAASLFDLRSVVQHSAD